MIIRCAHQELRSSSKFAAVWAPLQRVVNFSLPPSLSQLLPLHILLPVLSAASTACTPFKPPSCWGDIWHRPWFATGAHSHTPLRQLPCQKWGRASLRARRVSQFESRMLFPFGSPQRSQDPGYSSSLSVQGWVIGGFFLLLHLITLCYWEQNINQLGWESALSPSSSPCLQVVLILFLDFSFSVSFSLKH